MTTTSKKRFEDALVAILARTRTLREEMGAENFELWIAVTGRKYQTFAAMTGNREAAVIDGALAVLVTILRLEDE